MSNRTKWPYLARRECCNSWSVVDANGEDVIYSHYIGDECDGDHYGRVDKDNALIFAAAHELLMALEELLEEAHCSGKALSTHSYASNKARAAIARARGES